jgi:hypothetical protein
MTALCSVWTARAEEEEGKKSEAAAPLPKDQKEFSEKTARLNSLTTRIEEDEKQFQEMVQKRVRRKALTNASASSSRWSKSPMIAISRHWSSIS